MDHLTGLIVASQGLVECVSLREFAWSGGVAYSWNISTFPSGMCVSTDPKIEY